MKTQINQDEEPLKIFNKGNFPKSFTQVKITKKASVQLAQFAKNNQTNKTDAFEELMQFLTSNNIKLDDLWKLKDKILIPKYHNFTASFLQEFEKHHITHQNEFTKLFLNQINEIKKHNRCLIDLNLELIELSRINIGGSKYQSDITNKVISISKKRVEKTLVDHGFIFKKE